MLSIDFTSKIVLFETDQTLSMPGFPNDRDDRIYPQIQSIKRNLLFRPCPNLTNQPPRSHSGAFPHLRRTEMSQRKVTGAFTVNIVGLHAAAHHFGKLAKENKINPTFPEISTITGISKRTLQRYEDRDEWTQALRSIGHKGDMKFRRQKRSLAADATPEQIATATEIYQKAVKDGRRETDTYQLIADATGFSKNRVRYLAKKGYFSDKGETSC